MKKIPFNKPFLTGKETDYIKDAVSSGKISGNGVFTQKCQAFFEERFGFGKCLLTTSCTDALEMAAILTNIKPGDEVIVPSYTFVSSALAFIRQGAKIVFADSESSNPNIDATKIEELITNKTKVIVPVHYAGVACDMELIMNLAKKYNLYVVEDAAQAIDSFYEFKDGTKKALGSIGHFGAFSFHETKNVISGEGGMLTINDNSFYERAEIIWEKGTNRSKFFKGEIDKYGWVDTGSSFLPSEIIAAFLFAQLEHLKDIQNKRKEVWSIYYNGLEEFLDSSYLPYIPSYSTNNGHMFYIKCKTDIERSKLIDHLKSKNIYAVFHYLSLHKSEYYANFNNQIVLCNSDKFSETLLRLPFYYEITKEDVSLVIQEIKKFFYK
jgi:dTDP-4-amino-4,6-dideoxygalactose transaminase